MTVDGRPGGTWPSRLLRRAARHVPTPVAVVCTTDGPRPVGATIGSFVTVSLDPPLVAWFALRPSMTLDAVRRSGSFAVNVLAEDQADLAAQFAVPSAHRFRNVPWQPGVTGNPHLERVVVVLDCDLHDVVTLGDHEMVVGRVTSATTEQPGAEPLVFSGGRFRELSPVVPVPPLRVDGRPDRWRPRRRVERQLTARSADG